MHHTRATHPHRTMPATKRTWPALAGCCALAVLVLGPWETVTAETGQPALYGIISEEVNVSERQPVRLVPHGPLVRGATPGAGGVPDDSDVPGANGADKTNGTPDAYGTPHANSGHGVHGVEGVGDTGGENAATASARVPATSADVASGHAETTTPPDTAGVVSQTEVPQRPASPVRPDAQTATHSPAPSGIPHAVGDGARVAPSGMASGTTTSQPSGPAARPADAPAAVTTATPASATRYGTTSGTVHTLPSVSEHATASVSQHATASASQHATPAENLLDSMDVYALSPHAARLALPRMVPVVVAERLRVVRPAFPFWETAIDRASRTHALDPRLIAAVIRAESGYDPGAVSPRGAQGVMQIMPATQRELGLDDPFDPEANVEAGSRYLRQQLDRFGSLELALAAYNAGPGNVLKYGGMPPFDETRTFVRRVLDGMR
ncbi:Lytic transglycosylase, catalytic (plasmid) [Nitratidesulfovibrio vulgaris DP4]|uniref:Lytic transglycosylase, catalytic n=1 Tax=Nitratidesulfovibrio vulgaris (strain DP4) TaxID=391774 RepID=A0A0H3ABJ9_NITV4|nr:lytic transglycosylase domain-containing protein [Nitratidesulfovibrio vulgaris]ABM29992.1 Lytic transglycosylase, catalytic [Nitratidesulfovibrio vulgaris DP4]